MNKKLIFQLSLFGLAMSIATVFWIPSSIEPIFWLIIFLISAYFIAKQCNGKYFLHGFLVSLANCVYITSAHVVFFSSYTASHQEEMRMMSGMPINMRLLMAITGPIIGVVTGLVLGLFALIASKLVTKSE